MARQILLNLQAQTMPFSALLFSIPGRQPYQQSKTRFASPVPYRSFAVAMLLATPPTADR